MATIAAIGITAQAQDKLPSMAQLTPGNPEYLYAKSLLNTHWNEQGVFEYVKPDEADKAEALPREEEGLSADKLWRAVCDGDRLFVESRVSSVESKVSSDERLEVSDPSLTYGSDPGESDVVYGQSVHRNEFGIDGGLFWSPIGHKLAFYRMDQSMVQSYPLVQTDEREATVLWKKYPMAGMTSHQVTLGVFDPDTRQTVFLNTSKRMPDPEHYLACVTWRPDGKQIFVAELNREQNYMELNVYDVASGEYVQTLFSLSSKKYVEPEHPLYFLPGSNDKFIWQDERDGFDHLYLYDLSAKNSSCTTDQVLHYEGMAPLCQLTQGPWLVTDLIGADPKAAALYFIATKESPKERHLYAVSLKNAGKRGFKPEVIRLTADAGVHSIKMSPDFSEFYDSYTNPTTPRVCELVKLTAQHKRGKSEVLYEAPNPFEGYWRPEVEVGTLVSADGVTPLYYRLVKPRDFDPQKRYPAIVYLYNGPHAQMITAGFQHGLPGWDAYMASKGFVVFTIDGRGSANRGLEFENAIWHHLGEAESADQLKGIEYLKSLSYVDADRFGIYGWSYGGFMTTYMTLNYPDIFKVGVCGGPVLDWSRYEVMYGERYMGTPQGNPEGYAANCLINQTDKLRSKLLIIHDDQDATVVPQMSLQFLKGSVQTGSYPDFLMYPNHPHNVRGKDRIHLHNRIAQYFIDHL